MAISYVSTGTVYTHTSSSTNFTLNKPSGVAAGDFLIAQIAFYPGASASQRTVTNPSGWTTIRTVYTINGSDTCQISTMYRVAQSGDPSSWSGSISSATTEMVAGVVCYRGVAGVLVSGTSTAGSTSSYSTATVNNTASGSWRVVMAAYTSASASYNISSNETTRRWIGDATIASGATQAAHWDSNATVATGNTSRTVSRSASWACSTSVIAILQPESGTVASGDIDADLPKVTSTYTGTIEVPGSVAATLPSVTFSGSGEGAPIPGSGGFACTLPAATYSGTGSLEPRGTLDVLVLPIVNLGSESVPYGIRVIKVQAEDRVVKVKSRGVEG